MEITTDEWMAELDRLRPDSPDLTDAQYKLIAYARENERPVPWVKIKRAWEKRGWGKINDKTLASRYARALLAHSD